MSEEKKRVVVLGAGVHGLHAALAVLEAGYSVTVIAKHIPGDLDPTYCSPWAVTNWASDVTVGDPEVQRWYIENYRFWESLSSADSDESEAGVTRRTYYSYCDAVRPELVAQGPSAFWYHSMVNDFKMLAPEEFPDGVNFAYSFTSFCVNTPVYLNYLSTQIKSKGGSIIRSTLPVGVGIAGVVKAAAEIALKEKDEKVFAYVNCTGLGSKYLVPDDTMFPIRSHAIFLKGEAKQIADRLEAGESNMIAVGGVLPISYVSPRVGSGMSFCGGYMEEGEYGEKASEVITKRLLQRAKLLAPELIGENGEVELVSANVGLRPHRRGGPRIEIERLDGGESVVHSYGHGHGGFIKGIGSAGKILGLVNSL